MEKQKLIIIIADYSKSPGPRYCCQGDDSGEDFYHKILNNKFKIALESNQNLVIDLDGPDGYASSFLDEAFGNLVYDFGLINVKKIINLISNEEPEWIDMLENETYLQWEQRRKSNYTPKKTVEHEAWWKYNFTSYLIEKDIWIANSL